MAFVILFPVIYCIIQRHFKRALPIYFLDLCSKEWMYFENSQLYLARSELFQELVNDLLLEPVRLEVHVISFHNQPVEQTIFLELAKSNPVILI